jgi:hypothetical protein
MRAACHALEPRPTTAVENEDETRSLTSHFSLFTSHGPVSHCAFDNSPDPPLIKSRTLLIHKPGWS